jgi:hypothetical protein
MSFKNTLLLGLAVLTVSCSSCVRDYTCRCKIKYSGSPGLPDSTFREYTVRDTKDKAKSICEGNSAHTEQNGIKTDEDCTLY